MKNVKVIIIISFFLFLVSIVNVNAYYCYQESANVTNQTGIDGDCAIYTGTYGSDGTAWRIWNGSAFDTKTGLNATQLYNGIYYDYAYTNGVSSYFYINYTKPLGYINANWYVSYLLSHLGIETNYTENLTINSSCLTTNKLILRERSYNSYASLNFQCLDNTSNWIIIKNVDSLTASAFREEAIYWNITKVLNVNAYNYTGGIINNFNFTINGTFYGTTTGSVIVPIIDGYSYSSYLDAPGYAYSYYNFTANSSTIQYKNFTLYETNRVDVRIYDELTSNVITDTIILTIQSDTTLQNYTIVGGSYNITGSLPGDYLFTFTSVNYSTRTYAITIQNRTYQTLSARLLNNGNTSIIGLYTKTETFQVLEPVLVTIQKQYIGGSYATIFQGYTDVSGFITFNVDEGQTYRVILEADGYVTKQFNQQFFVANSPYTFLLTNSAETAYVNVLDGVNYYYYPNYTNLNQSIYSFGITAYNSSFIIAWIAVNANGTITNVTGSSGGGTASTIVDLSAYTGTYYVIYMFNYYNTNTGAYSTYQIPINYYINTDVPYNTTLPQSLNNLKNDVGSSGWLAILSVFIIFTAVITIIQLSGNILAGIGVGFGAMIFLAFIGWIPGMLVAFIVVISGLLLYLDRGN